MSLVGFEKLRTWPRALDFLLTVGGGFMFYPPKKWEQCSNIEKSHQAG